MALVYQAGYHGAEWQKNRRASFYAFFVRWLRHHYKRLEFMYHCLCIKHFNFCWKIAPINIHHLRTQFLALRSKPNCAIPHFQSGRFWYTNVHKLTPHKEIGAWHRRGLVYQPVTGRNWKTGLLRYGTLENKHFANNCTGNVWRTRHKGNWFVNLVAFQGLSRSRKIP